MHPGKGEYTRGSALAIAILGCPHSPTAGLYSAVHALFGTMSLCGGQQPGPPVDFPWEA